MSKVEFIKRIGKMAECLGVDVELSAKIDKIVSKMLAQDNGMIEIIEHVRDNLDLNPSQFAAFMWALGYYSGSNNL